MTADGTRPYLALNRSGRGSSVLWLTDERALDSLTRGRRLAPIGWQITDILAEIEIGATTTTGDQTTMIGEESRRTAPYPHDADAYATGRRHAAEGRYSLTASTGPGWIYWYCEGRGDALEEAGR